MADQMVRYIGGARRREITADAWASAGVEDMPTVVWGRDENGKQIEKSEFSEDALKVLRRSPREFRIDGEDQPEAPPRPSPGPHAEQRVSVPTPPDQIPNEDED